MSIPVPTHFNVSDYFMLELSDYKRKLEQKETAFNSQSYNKVFDL